MMTPMDTALLKHRPDHHKPLTDIERAAHSIARENWRPSFVEFIAQVFSHAPRHPTSLTPAE